MERPLIFVSLQNSKNSTLGIDNLAEITNSLNENLVDILEIEIDSLDIDLFNEQLSFLFEIKE